MGSQQQLCIPDMGDFTTVDVVEVLVAAGDRVAAGQGLITLESDKASMELPAPGAGEVLEVLVSVGDSVAAGTPYLLLRTGEAGATAGDTADQSTAAGQREIAPSEGTADWGDGRTVDVYVPDIGDFSDVDVIEILAGPGDRVAPDDPLVTIESDKASTDVPAPFEGRVLEVLIQVGDKVSAGSRIMRMAPSRSGPAGSPVPPAEPVTAPSEAGSTGGSRALGVAGGERWRPPLGAVAGAQETAYAAVHAAPDVKRFARELGVNLQHVEGSGRKGRILRSDVRSFVRRALKDRDGGLSEPSAAVPAADFRRFGDVEIRSLDAAARVRAAHWQRARQMVPQVSHHDYAHIDALESFCRGVAEHDPAATAGILRLTLVLRALARAMMEFPAFNASLAPDGEHLILKRYLNFSVSIAVPDGLRTGLIRDVGRRSLIETAGQLRSLAIEGAAGELQPFEPAAACLGVTDLGSEAGWAFSPLVEPPMVAALGLSRPRQLAWWDRGEFRPRLCLPLHLSYDHRVIDGAEAARFLARCASLLEDSRRALL